MALWNIGAFMLRTSPDASSAVFAEVVIHIGVLLVPAFWYHFVLIFLDATTRHRPSLTAAYAIALVYSLVNLSGSPLFMKGVVWTHWGWAPATGPLYLPFVVVFNFFMIYGLRDRKSTRLNSSHLVISYAVFCLRISSSPQHCDSQISTPVALRFGSK